MRVILSGSGLKGRTTECVTVVPGLPSSMKRITASGRSCVDWPSIEIDHIAVAQMFLVGGRAGQHIDDRGVAEALGDGDAHLRIVGGGAVFVDLVLGRRQIAGIGIERVEQAVQRAGGHLGNVGRR